MDVELVSDFDLHPDEPYVRQFQAPRPDVLRLDGSAFVCEAEFDGVVVRHYAFAAEWFKVTATFDRAGGIVETPATQGVARPFAFNCDISTPMLSDPSAVYGVDLFLDVLVRADGLSHDVIDVDEFDEAISVGLLSAVEVEGARSGLERLVVLVVRGELLAFLDDACPFGPSTAGPALPMLRAPLVDLPLVQPGHRPTWFEVGPQSADIRVVEVRRRRVSRSALRVRLHRRREYQRNAQLLDPSRGGGSGVRRRVRTAARNA